MGEQLRVNLPKHICISREGSSPEAVSLGRWMTEHLARDSACLPSSRVEKEVTTQKSFKLLKVINFWPSQN